MMKPATRAVILDHTTLFGHDAETTQWLGKVIAKLQSLGHKVVVFSTDRIPIQQRLQKCGLPNVDLYLSSADVGTKKGTKAWTGEVSQRLGIPNHRMLYVGDDEQDWREAINSGVFPLHAKWSKGEHAKKPIAVNMPRDCYRFLSHFFLPDERWEYRLDVPGSGLVLRSLLHPDTRLKCDGGGAFTPKDVFTYGKPIVAGGWRAANLLMLHGISNLYTEGLIPACCWFAVYPSHAAGKLSPLLAQFLEPAATFFHGFFKPDLLIRATDAPDTSLARVNGQPVLFTHQANTIHVNPAYKNKIGGRTVIVFDDFTTDGMGLEWARTLLTAAGAGNVICMTVGKFGQRHRVYRAYNPAVITPFQLGNYVENQFGYVEHAVQSENAAKQVSRKMFEDWTAGKSYPL